MVYCVPQQDCPFWAKIMIDALQAIIDRFSEDPEARVTQGDVSIWAGSLNNWDFYNSISLQIAQKYQAGELSYATCDRLMNDLWGAVVSGLPHPEEAEIPDPFYDIYLAFDAGEYHRKADRSDDPVADFTNPMISELLLHYLPADTS